jgi:hypothetical protein
MLGPPGRQVFGCGAIWLFRRDTPGSDPDRRDDWALDKPNHPCWQGIRSSK